MNHLDNTTFNLYLDDALDAKTRAHADAHLAACETCQRELAELRALVSTFEMWRDEPIPRDVSRVVVARLAERPLPANVSRWGALVLGAQIIFATLLFVWALPLVLRVLSGVSFGALPTLSLSPLTNFAALFNDFALPFPQLGLWVWGLVVLGAGIAWLIGNRLIFSFLQNQQEAAQ